MNETSAKYLCILPRAEFNWLDGQIIDEDASLEVCEVGRGIDGEFGGVGGHNIGPRPFWADNVSGSFHDIFFRQVQ